MYYRESEDECRCTASELHAKQQAMQQMIEVLLASFKVLKP